VAGLLGAGRPVVIAPVVTLYGEDLRVDVEAAQRFFRVLADSGVGIFVSGTTGEMPLLDYDEKVLLLEAALDAARGRVPVLVGVGGPDPSMVLAEARALAALGPDAIVVPTPYYYKPPPFMLESFYDWLAGRVDANIIVYTIPSHTGVEIPLPVLERLAAERSNIIGVKATVDSSLYQFQLVRSLKSVRSSFLVLSGFDHLLPYNLAIGGDGGIVAGANIAPLLHKELAASRGPFDQRLLDSLHSLVILMGMGASVPGALKTILRELGIAKTNLVRPPLPPETEATERRVVEAWRASGLDAYFPGAGE